MLQKLIAFFHLSFPNLVTFLSLGLIYSYIPFNLLFSLSFDEILSYHLSPAPTSPLEVVATNTSSTSIMVDWSPPAIPRGIITSYFITYYVTSAGENSSRTEVIVTDATNGTVDGLMKFTQYSLYVQASTVAGIGDRSETVTVFTDEDSESTHSF